MTMHIPSRSSGLSSFMRSYDLMLPSNTNQSGSKLSLSSWLQPILVRYSFFGLLPNACQIEPIFQAYSMPVIQFRSTLCSETNLARFCNKLHEENFILPLTSTSRLVKCVELATSQSYLVQFDCEYWQMSFIRYSHAFSMIKKKSKAIYMLPTCIQELGL